MKTPKVQFNEIPLSKEIDWIYGFLFNNDWGWSKYIVKKHPGLKKALVFKQKKERLNFVKNYIFKFKKDNKEAIENNKIKYSKNWQIIESDFFKILSEILDVKWPKNKKTIKAMISINPICPRFLNDWSFSIFYNYKKLSHTRETIMHEACHFLYFEKWKKLYPKMNTKKFEAPFIEWHLSEIVAPIILNDKRIQKLLKQKAVFYEEHQRLKIKGKSVPKYFTDLYNKNKQEKKKFEVFIKEAYKIIKDNKELFSF